MKFGFVKWGQSWVMTSWRKIFRLNESRQHACGLPLTDAMKKSVHHQSLDNLELAFLLNYNSSHPVVISTSSLSQFQVRPRQRFPIAMRHVDGMGAGNDFNLDRDLSLPLKSLSPHQPPGWNDPYRSHKQDAKFPAFLRKRLPNRSRKAASELHYLLLRTGWTKVPAFAG